MRVTASLLLVCAIVLAMAFGGCCGGGSKETTVVTQPTGSTTVGQELTDLKKAHDEGAISDAEYEQEREKILKSE